MTTVAATAHTAHAHHDDRSFIRKYIFSTDHKIIGIQFLFVSLFFLLVGGLLAMQMRWQLAYPGQPMPGGGILPESMAPGGVILPEYYIQLVTMHGTFMVFFAIMPLLVGVYANFLIPLKIGTHDMAFPRINMASFWLAFAAGLVMFASLFVPDGAARAGWTMYVPLSARHDYSGASLGQELWSVSIILLGLSSILGSLLHHHRDQQPRAGDDVVPAAALGVVAVHHGDPRAARAAGALGCRDHVVVRPGPEYALLRHDRGRSGPPVAAPLLVLRAPGGLHPDPARDGHGLGHRRERQPQADLRLSLDGVRDRRDRVPRLDRVGPPHVRQRDEPDARLVVHGVDPDHRRALRGQGVQLDGHDVARQPAVPRADAQRHGIRGDVRDRRAVGGLHGRDTGGHVHPRHLLHRRAPALRAVRRQPVRAVRRDHLLVPQDVRPGDERAVGQGALLAHVRLLQLHVLPDAHPRDGGRDAADLRPDAVRLPEADAADERVHHRQRVPVVRDAADLLRELLVQPVQGEEGGPEPVARQRARVVAPLAGAARQLGDGADRVPWAVRVQLAPGGGGLPAAKQEAAHRP